jgi:hypothetical protein
MNSELLEMKIDIIFDYNFPSWKPRNGLQHTCCYDPSPHSDPYVGGAPLRTTSLCASQATDPRSALRCDGERKALDAEPRAIR